MKVLILTSASYISTCPLDFLTGVTCLKSRGCTQMNRALFSCTEIHVLLVHEVFCFVRSCPSVIIVYFVIK